MFLSRKYLSYPDIQKSESIVIIASPEVIMKRIETLDFSKSRLIAFLFRIRGLPVPAAMNREGLERINFITLEQRNQQELIIGLIGKFWTIKGNLIKFSPREFLKFSHPDFLKATWSFEVFPVNGRETLVRTTTQVKSYSPRTKKLFGIYWAIIKPFSTAIRHAILRQIKSQAEEDQWRDGLKSLID